MHTPLSPPAPTAQAAPDWLPAWVVDNDTLLTWLGIASVAMFLATLLALPIVIARLPPDYFSAGKEPESMWAQSHPALRITMRILRNALGVLLLILGLIFLLTPGQGLLSILVALILIDFPGRRRLVQRVARNRRLLAALNWIRTKRKRPPFLPPPPAQGVPRTA